ncbi:MAG: hypothetical protein AB1715_00720 [Acidobacteriota bacterium]
MPRGLPQLKTKILEFPISVEGTGKDGRQGIYRVDVETSAVVPIVLIDKGQSIFSHRWSQDGLLMFYLRPPSSNRTGRAAFPFPFECT